MSRRHFGTDGIRDVAGEGALTPEKVRAYGRAVGAWLAESAGPSRVLVGRDTRASGPTLLEQMGEGFVAAGHTLVDGGVLSTPAVQTLCREEDFALAVVISASHNPAQDNGLKFFGADGRKLADEAELAIEDRIDAALADSLAVGAAAAGRVEADETAGDRYLRFLSEVACPGLSLTGFKLVVDAAHGAAYRLAPEALRGFGAEVLVHGASPDGKNINDGAGVFAVDALAERVRAAGADLGIALDGDADRVLLAGPAGTVRDGDHVLGVLAADLHARGALAGDVVVATVMSNLGLKVWLAERGIRLEVVPVGDRHVSQRMQEIGAVVGGEQSGHVILHEGERWYGDGLLAALRVLQVMQRTGRALPELAQGLEKFPQVLENVRVKRKPPIEKVPPLETARRTAEQRLGEEGRVLLRYSGTEHLLRVMVEGRDEGLVLELARSLADIVREELA